MRLTVPKGEAKRKYGVAAAVRKASGTWYRERSRPTGTSKARAGAQGAALCPEPPAVLARRTSEVVGVVGCGEQRGSRTRPNPIATPDRAIFAGYGETIPRTKQ